MTYTGFAQLKPGTPERRLNELSQQLEELNCAVRFNRERSKLEFELLDDESLWMTTGQLTLLFIKFSDVISRQGHGYASEGKGFSLEA